MTKKFNYVAGSIALILFTTVVAGLAYCLHLYLPWVAVLPLSLFLYWRSVQYTVKLVLYPGASWLYKKAVEANADGETCRELLGSLTDLTYFLKFLERGCAHSSLLYSDTILNQLWMTLNTLNSLETSLTIGQKYILTQLSSLHSRVQVPCVQMVGTPTASLADLLNNDLPMSELQPIVTDLSVLNSVINTVTELQRFVEGRSAKMSRVLSMPVLGSTSYLRGLLAQKFNGQQVWVDAKDYAKLDCMWIAVGDPRSPCVLLCSANAVSYEVYGLNIEWVQFYLDLGINVMLWNYRGYGRSSGSPSLTVCASDGASVLQFITEWKHPRLMGIHGHSIGGAIAVGIARLFNVDFLFADRTFSSIQNAAEYGFGKVAKWAVQLTGQGSSNIAAEYSLVDCDKLLSCDVRDKVIQDVGSLKSGLAILALNKPVDAIKALVLERQGLFEVLDALRTVKLTERKVKMRSDSGELNYISFEDENTFEIVTGVVYILEQLTILGKPLVKVIDDPDQFLSLLSWLKQVEIWLDSQFVQCLEYTLTRLRRLKQRANVLLTEIDTLANFITALKTHVNTLEVSDKRTFGHVISVVCGHQGILCEKGRDEYTKHLTNAKFTTKL